MAPSLSVRTGRKGLSFSVARLMLEGIFYGCERGIAWWDLPAEFGPWRIGVEIDGSIRELIDKCHGAHDTAAAD